MASNSGKILMNYPKLGMSYSDCAKRIRRISYSPGNMQAKLNLVNSLRNQCRLAEGDSALKELDAEAFSKHKRSSDLTGAGTKQLGVCCKFDCINRDKECNKCIKGSAYSSKKLIGSATIQNAVGGKNGNRKN